MEIYNYDSETKEFINSRRASIDPLETKKTGVTVYLIPANATHVPPPISGNNECPVFVKDGSNEYWQLVSDYRGEVYYLEDGTEIVIENLGEIIPEGALLEKPVIDFKIADENEIKIEAKMREIAIESLKQSGDLPIDYVDPNTK